MKLLAPSSSILALAVLLAACGGSPDDAEAPAGPADAAAKAPAVAADAAAGAAASADTAAAGEQADASAAAGAEPVEAPGPKPAASAGAAVAAKPPAGFAICSACHKVAPGEHGIGPSLAGVFGARSAHAADFDYTPAMKGAGLKWDEANLHRYLENPRAVVPGTNMAFAGIKDQAKRQEVIDYLKTL